MERAVEMNRLWHSRLPEFTSPPERCIAFGAEYEGRFYVAAIWSPPLARLLNNTGRYELRRMAIAPDAPANTGSRALRVMRLLLRKIRPGLKTLISYQDTGVHEGTIYKAAGWKAVAHRSGSEWATKARDSRPTQAPTAKIRWEIAA
jgi:hypothetical protein